MDQCIDSRGSVYLSDIFDLISKAMGCENPVRAIAEFRQMMKEMELGNPVAGDREEDLNILSTSVNPVRLKNNPIMLNGMTIKSLYERIVY